MNFDIVVPLWNEEKNIPHLIKMFEESNLQGLGLKNIILVDNGSVDKTTDLAESAAAQNSMFKFIRLNENVNYGGGIVEGLKICESDFVGHVPGDLQVTADDIEKVWKRTKQLVKENSSSMLLVKGYRSVRKDGWNTRIASFVYTLLAMLVLRIYIKDVNGLPKIYNREILNILPSQKIKTFVLDAQIIHAAKRSKWVVDEVAVTFHARREGVSTWSKKRLPVYLESIRLLFKVKKLWSLKS